MTVTTVTMIDATGACSAVIPSNTPKVAGYVTGSGGVQWTPADWSRFSPSQVIRIDQSPGTGDLQAQVKDVEPGAASNDDALSWGLGRRAAGFVPCWYTSRDNLTPLLNTLDAGGLTSGQLWVADWSLNEDEAAAQVKAQSGPFPVKAIQWASPTSNPKTLLPGTTMTLAKANCDLSVADASWPHQ
jgi:hypothetical protein